MLVTRVITGIVGIIAAGFIINAGGAWFGAATVILAALGWHEYCRAFSNIGIRPWYTAGMAAVVLVIFCAWLGNVSECMAVLTLAVLAVLARTVLNYPSFTVNFAAATLMGIFYLGLPFAHLVLLRFSGQDMSVSVQGFTLEAGAVYIWIAFIGTWASDTFAYFFGRAFGKHKLCPNVSPGKTREGFIGGIVGTMASLGAAGWLFSMPIAPMALLGLGVALVATLGDLVESAIKRLTGIKDSGNIIPGHGGVLDRFDSILFTAPFVYYFLEIFL
jgi:phosphatidate cytidylyltransferase